MNIFFLSNDPILAAMAQCDQHVVKMVLESAQLMSTTYREFGHDAPYHSTHRNHPCAVWLRESRDHYTWFANHAMALAREYTVRYGKHHKSEEVIRALYSPPDEMKDTGWRDPPQCVPEQHKRDDTVAAYRAYYQDDKARFARWATGSRTPPEWWKATTT